MDDQEYRRVESAYKAASQPVTVEPKTPCSCGLPHVTLRHRIEVQAKRYIPWGIVVVIAIHLIRWIIKAVDQ